MFERLKSLPLTILLTILIWMYAESQVNSADEPERVEVPDVPVYISGPPAMLARYDITVQPQTIKVTVTGTREHIDALRTRLQAGGAAAGIYAYLDVSPNDRPAPNSFIRRPLHFATPDGLTVIEAPIVSFQMVEHSPATQRGDPSTP